MRPICDQIKRTRSKELLSFRSSFFEIKVDICIANVPRGLYTQYVEGFNMNKTYSMSIRVSEEELDKLKQAARLEAYASYSEFVRRTALLEASKIIEDNRKKEND